RMEVVPTFWFLTLTSDCRVFQHLNAVDIVQQVLKGIDLDVRCKKSPPKREYCVQYRETNFDFVSRLLEEEGIFYFFEHTASKHTMVLSDDASSAKACPGGAAARVVTNPSPSLDADVVLEVSTSVSMHTEKVTLRDYDPLQPGATLETAAG